MRINASRFYTLLFGAVILLQLYLPSFKANVFIQIVVLGFVFFFEKKNVPHYFLRILLPIIGIFMIGFIGMLVHLYGLFYISKDIFHFIKPLLGLAIGFYLFRKINNFRKFIKSIILLGFVSALIHFGIIFFFTHTDTVSDIREYGKDNFLELFAIFFLGYYKKFKGEALFPKKWHYVIFVILLLSNIFYFSRTMLVVAIIMFMSLGGYTVITLKTIKILGALLVMILLLYAYLYSIKIDRNGQGIEGFFYKVKNAPEELFKSKINRNNHADLWDHWRSYEAERAFDLMENNPSSYLFGCGHGSLVNLRFFAPLTDNAKDKGLKYISELHNGYVYLFYKTGIIGLLVYLGFLGKLYKKVYRQRTIEALFVSAIGVIFMFTTLTITGIYNTRDIIILILGALLFYDKQAEKTTVTLKPEPDGITG